MLSKTEDLILFLAVIDCGSFSQAAINQDIQVAKVSRAIKRLENTLKTTLFIRSTRRIELTDEGRTYAAAVRDSLANLNMAAEQLQSQQHIPKGELRIDAASPFVLHQIVPLVAEFRARYPDIELKISSNDSLINLIEKRVDIAIRIGKLADSNLYAKHLGNSPLHIVASPDYLKRAGAPKKINDLANHQWIGFADMPHLNRIPIRNSENFIITPNLSADSGEAVRQLCLGGNGLAVLSHFMVANDLQRGHLLSVLPDEITSPNAREPIYAIYYQNGQYLPSRIRCFIDFAVAKMNLSP